MCKSSECIELTDVVLSTGLVGLGCSLGDAWSVLEDIVDTARDGREYLIGSIRDGGVLIGTEGMEGERLIVACRDSLDVSSLSIGIEGGLSAVSILVV